MSRQGTRREIDRLLREIAALVRRGDERQRAEIERLRWRLAQVVRASLADGLAHELG